jgi:hypothetical protein
MLGSLTGTSEKLGILNALASKKERYFSRNSFNPNFCMMNPHSSLAAGLKNTDLSATLIFN